MKKLFLVAVLISLGTSAVQAQSEYTEHTLRLDSLANMPAAKISDVAWLSGNWVAEAFGGLAEDIWSDPAGGAMMGMFRSISKGEVGFYELFTISEFEESLILRLRHFNADLTAWEEKGVTQDFPLVKIDKNTAWFEGFTIVKKGKNEYTIYLAMDRADGSVREMIFEYTRRKGK
tara:strand:- start:1308 stop:1832 length:525 start_codon:yes stop_codon:yes gene_type:complete